MKIDLKREPQSPEETLRNPPTFSSSGSDMTDETSKLLQLETAVQALVFAIDRAPGADLGVDSQAVSWIEIRKCLKDLAEIRGYAPNAEAILKIFHERHPR